MENEMIKFIVSQGAFAGLFVYLLWYVLETNNKREINYQNIIQELSSKFRLLELVCNDLEDIKSILRGVEKIDNNSTTD